MTLDNPVQHKEGPVENSPDRIHRFTEKEVELLHRFGKDLPMKSIEEIPPMEGDIIQNQEKVTGEVMKTVSDTEVLVEGGNVTQEGYESARIAIIEAKISVFTYIKSLEIAFANMVTDKEIEQRSINIRETKVMLDKYVAEAEEEVKRAVESKDELIILKAKEKIRKAEISRGKLLWLQSGYRSIHYATENTV